MALLAVVATTVATIAIPIKIWNLTRIEMKLEVQERLLLEARLDALQSQINPHFLFNTLNSVSSLVRFDPDRARELIVKLSKILRRLLGKHDEFVQLREEIEFVDDYLDIEVVRFGRDKLRVYKNLDPETLDIVIPAILLQPLVENSIKHGLAPKVDGGSITIRSRMQDGKLMIQVEDDGVGMSAPPAVAAEQLGSGRGIGMVNVAERLHVLLAMRARSPCEAVTAGNAGDAGNTCPEYRVAAARRCGRNLCGAFQYPLIKLFVLRNDPGGAKARLRFPSRHFPHLAQPLFIGKNVNGIARHGLHIAHFSKKTAASMVHHLRNSAHCSRYGGNSQAMASSADRPKDSISLGTSIRSAIESFS